MKLKKALKATMLITTAMLGLVSTATVAMAKETVDDAVRLYKQGNYKEAARIYKDLAEQGNSRAQYNLGLMYDKGEGVAKDYSQAAKWYQEAAEKGHIEAQYDLGVMYAEGEGVRQDYRQAEKWWKKAAEQGYANAQFNLGMMYANGYGVPKNYKQAAKWYAEAAHKGNAEAPFNLGDMYANGQGVAKDLQLAINWYTHAAINGNANASYKLCLIYLDKAEDYVSWLTDAEEWCEKAEANGMVVDDADTQYKLGHMYDIKANARQDYQRAQKAVKWYQKAAEQGHVEAQYHLGSMYYYERGDVARDYRQAVKWYRKAAEQGYSVAQSRLGWMYEEGNGVKKDLNTAKKWFEKACRNGSKDSCTHLQKLSFK